MTRSYVILETLSFHPKNEEYFEQLRVTLFQILDLLEDLDGARALILCEPGLDSEMFAVFAASMFSLSRDQWRREFVLGTDPGMERRLDAEKAARASEEIQGLHEDLVVVITYSAMAANLFRYLCETHGAKPPSDFHFEVPRGGRGQVLRISDERVEIHAVGWPSV